MVVLRRDGGGNWLDSDWTGPFPQASPEAPFSYTLFGATVWAGPQSAFWTDQDLVPKLKAAKAKWPPDPYFEWGRSAVKELSEQAVEFTLPDSPITGLKLVKTYRITGPGHVTMAITATNTRDRVVERDLWPDVHIDPRATVRVPLADKEPLRFTPINGDNPPAMIREGDHAVWPGEAAGGAEWSAKAFVHAARQQIFCSRDDDRLTMSGSLDDIKSVHPEHAPVEIYRSGGSRPRLEAEMHGALRALKPGESMQFTLSFELSESPTTRPAK